MIRRMYCVRKGKWSLIEPTFVLANEFYQKLATNSASLADRFVHQRWLRSWNTLPQEPWVDQKHISYSRHDTRNPRLPHQDLGRSWLKRTIWTFSYLLSCLGNSVPKERALGDLPHFLNSCPGLDNTGMYRHCSIVLSGNIQLLLPGLGPLLPLQRQPVQAEQ